MRSLADLPARLGDCRGVLVDSNILIDIAFQDERWYEWSSQALTECLQHSLLFINPIVYAEVSLSYSTINELDAALPTALFRRESLPWAAGFLAGKSFREYRRRCRISTSALMLHPHAWPCSPGISPDFAATSLRLSCSLRPSRLRLPSHPWLHWTLTSLKESNICSTT